MKKEVFTKGRREIHLGELIDALFTEAENVYSEPAERKVAVYAALNDLLSRVLNHRHRITLKV